MNSKLSSLNDIDTATSSLQCKSPIKRKKKFVHDKSSKRVQSHRANLNDSAKAKIQADDTAKHQTRRANLDDSSKAKIQDQNTTYQKGKRAKLDDSVKQNSSR